MLGDLRLFLRVVSGVWLGGCDTVSDTPQCHLPLEGVAGQMIERRQVHDLPRWRIEVTEHQVEEVECPRCQQRNRGSFPAEVSAPAQYGPGVRALAVYLHQYQLVPMQRTCELLADLCGCELSEGTLTSWIELAAETLVPSMEQIKQGVLASPLQHADETGVRLGGKLHWLSAQYLWGARDTRSDL